jgi:chemotaxis-related protein WspD
LLTVTSPGGGDASRTRLIVMRHEGVRVAGVADEVDGIHRVLPEDVKPVPATVARASTPHSRGVVSVQGRGVGVLDDRRLFQDIQRGLA